MSLATLLRIERYHGVVYVQLGGRQVRLPSEDRGWIAQAAALLLVEAGTPGHDAEARGRSFAESCR